MTHVLIAADDTEESVHAARIARDLFGDTAQYTVVSVARTRAMLWTGSSMEWGVPYTMMVPPAGVAGPPLVFQHPTSDQPHHTPVDIAERQADDVAVAAHLAGADTMGDVGDPADAIARAAQACGADVVVVGSHDRGWFSRLFTRSVSSELVRDAPLPVLVVH
ncbi:MAG: universal stress protein [Acidimicrobiales bacterium]|nr:universal stress protein [Acidimicrobiales bacterium]MCB9393554.1 universal stress protein [Acidimicrobiaceae bacterium]